jgi:hypothetical protein
MTDEDVPPASGTPSDTRQQMIDIAMMRVMIAMSVLLDELPNDLARQVALGSMMRWQISDITVEETFQANHKSAQQVQNEAPTPRYVCALSLADDLGILGHNNGPDRRKAKERVTTILAECGPDQIMAAFIDAAHIAIMLRRARTLLRDGDIPGAELN